MKKVVFAVLLISSVCFAQHPALNLYNARLNEGRPFLTYQGITNSYDLFNSPIGVFSVDSSSLSLEANYSFYSLDREEGHFFNAPVLRMGEPRRAFFQLFYGPNLLSYNIPATDFSAGNEISLFLHRFGLTMATQSPSGSFQASLMGLGHIGTQSWKYGSDTRTIMGLENVRIDFGSRVHQMAGIGVFISAALYLDTLKASYTGVAENYIDRSAQVILPSFGGFVDFGSGDFPIRSHLSLQYTPSMFVYVVRDGNPPSAGDLLGVDSFDNAYSMNIDSLQAFWMTAGRIPLGEHIVKPGLLLGFSLNSAQLRLPHRKSDPFKMKDDVPGGFYDLTEFYLGIGTGYEVINYADLFFEYVFNTAMLNCGRHFPQDYAKSRFFHNFGLGVSTSLHNYVPMPFFLSPRVAYFISQSAGAVEARHMNIDPLNPAGGGVRSREIRYSPHTYLQNRESTSGVTVGLDAQSPDRRFGGSVYSTFLNKKRGEEKQSGMEMGILFSIGVAPLSDHFD
ncbi:MAG: hypothetical protein FWE57_06680 [Chitinispirillia bacterium]|nr:hypothetical protein [Chitinispirillia bacterium]